MGPFSPFVRGFIFELSGTSVKSFARLYGKTCISTISYCTETTRSTCDTRYRYHGPTNYNKQQFAAGTPIVLLCEKSDAVRIEPRPHSISQHVPPLRVHLADVVSTPSGLRRHPDAGRARRVQTEHRVGSRIIVEQYQFQAHSCSSTRGSSTSPDDGSHIHRIVRPRCRTESSWLRAGRVWACTRPLQSVHAAAELVCR